MQPAQHIAQTQSTTDVAQHTKPTALINAQRELRTNLTGPLSGKAIPRAPTQPEIRDKMTPPKRRLSCTHNLTRTIVKHQYLQTLNPIDCQRT